MGGRLVRASYELYARKYLFATYCGCELAVIAVHMSGLKRWAMLLVATLAAGCQQGSDACSYLNDGYRRLDLSVGSLPAYPLEQVPDSVVGEIQKCWAAKPYGGPQHGILLTEARKANSGRYFLLFEASGITDVMLVFLVDPERGVIEAYQHGTL